MKSLCSVFLGLSLLAIPSVHGMEATAAKAMAKKLFSHAMTVLHWGVATLPFWEKAYEHGKIYWNIDDELAKMDDAPAEIKTFVRSELKKSGIEHADAISVKQANLGGMLWAALFDKAIVIDTSDAVKKYPGCNLENLQKALAGSSVADVEALNAARCFIHHEAGHLKSNDSLKRGIAYAVAPVAMYAAAKGLLLGRLKLLQKLGREIPQQSYSIGKSLLKLPSALIKSVATNLSLNQYFQQQEWAADEHVPAQKELLSAGKKCSLMEEQSEHAGVMKQYPVLQFFQNHPSNAVRIARLEERIAELDAQESQQKQL